MRFRGLLGWLGDHRAVVAAIAAVALIVGSGATFEAMNTSSRHPAPRVAPQVQQGGTMVGAESAPTRPPSSPTPSSPTPSPQTASSRTPSSAPAPSQGTSTDVVPKPTTTVLTPADVSAVSGSPSGAQTVTLARAAAVPVIGHVLVAPPSSVAPYGLLGTVTGISTASDGASMVTTTPATLDEAYSKFQVSTNQSVTSSDARVTSSIEGAGPGGGGQLASTTVEPMAGQQSAAASADTAQLTAALSSNAARLTAASSTQFDLSEAAFTCTGSADHTITVTGDLSDMKVDLSLNASISAPSIDFLVTADPIFSVSADFVGQMDCHLADAKFLTITIPVPAAPELEVSINPVIDLSANGNASLKMQWKPRAEVGFYKAAGTSMATHGFGSSGSVTATANAAADLFLGFNADISLAGRVGVGGEFGPDLPVTYDSATGCITADSQLKTDLIADANIFVRDWSFTIATGTFDKSQLYSKCAPAKSPSPSSSSLPSTTPSPSPSGTPSPSPTAVKTRITVTASPNPEPNLHPITFTATVTAQNGTHPAGSVEFGFDPPVTVAVNASGVASTTAVFAGPFTGEVEVVFTPTSGSYLPATVTYVFIVDGPSSSPAPSGTPAGS